MNDEKKHEDLGGDVALVIWRMRRQIVALGVIGFLVGVLMAAIDNPSFRASATFRLTEDTPVGGILGELSALTAAPPAKAEMELLRSRGIMEDAFDRAAELGQDLETRLDDLDTYSPGRSLMRWLTKAPGPKSRFHIEVLEWPRESPKTVSMTIREAEIVLQVPGMFGFNWGFEPDPLPFVSGEEIEWQGIRFILTSNMPVATERHMLLRHTSRALIVPSILGRASVREKQRGSGVVQIDFEDTDPHRAALIVNHVLEAYIERNRERTAKRAGKTIEYVDEQLERVQDDLLEAESKLVNFRSSSGAISLSDEAVVLIDKSSDLELQKVQLGFAIQEQETALEWARENRDSGVATLATMPEGTFDPVSLAILDSLGKVQAERVHQATEWTDEAPIMVALDEQIAALTSRFISHLEGRVKGEHMRLNSIEAMLEAYEMRLAGLPETERELAQLMRQAKSLEDIYTFLLTQLHEARIAEASAVAPVEIIDRALPPTERFKPQLRTHGAVGLIFGVMLGIGLSLLRSSRGLLIATATALETYAGATVFASVPDFRRGRTKSKGARAKFHLPVRDSPNSPTAHAYSALRAALKFAQKGRKLTTMTITSSVQGEGKSTTLLNLALSLAKSGSRVLVIDADIRRPVIHKHFSKERKGGLVEILSDGLELEEAVQATDQENLSIITAGKSHEHPGELLAMPQMSQVVSDADEKFDYVLFDVPPVLAVADAFSFLNELDGIFLLCRANKVPGAVVESAAHRLQLSGGDLVGAILNGLKTSRFGGYGYGYGYSYGYGYASSYKYKADQSES